MRKAVLFLDQQSWLGGAQRVLEATLGALPPELEPIVAFPDAGPFRTSLEHRGIKTLTLPLGSYRSGRKSRLEMAAFAVRSALSGLFLALTMGRKGVALIWVNGPRGLPAGTLAAWLTRRPLVFHLHLILTRKPEIVLVSFLARRASKVVACSRAAAQILIEADPRLSARTEILYNPAPGLRSRRGAARDPASVTIGIVGRITPGKGHHLMVHAVGRLPVQVRNRVRVIVVGAPAPDCAGDINYAADLRAEAARYSLEETIAWVGYQSDPAPFYALMDVLLHPALSEALCLAILEALEAGVPVIAARTGGNPEIITEGRNGLLTPPEDLEALTAAIGRFVEDAALRSRLEAGARLGLDGRFSPGGFQSSVRSLVGELCGGRRGPGSRFVKPQPRAQVAGRPRESPPVRARSRPRF